eukprot:gene20900-27750_t
MLAMRSSTLAPRAAARPATRAVAPVGRRTSVKVMAAAKGFPQDWLKLDPLVLGASFIGWTAPSSIGTSALGGDSLFGVLNASIGEQLANFPVGPAIGDKFWLYMITWHVGLFTTMLFGRIGVEGKKQGYW